MNTIANLIVSLAVAFFGVEFVVESGKLWNQHSLQAILIGAGIFVVTFAVASLVNRAKKDYSGM